MTPTVASSTVRAGARGGTVWGAADTEGMRPSDTTLQARWLVYAVILIVPAVGAWTDAFWTIATGDSEESLLRTGTITSYLLFAAALALPLLYVALERLRTNLLANQRSLIPALYLFAAAGYIVDAITFAATGMVPGDGITYLWAGWLMIGYLPVATIVVVLLSGRPTTKEGPPAHVQVDH